MENSVNNRIRIIYKSFNITLKTFSDRLDMSEGTLKSMFTRGTNPSFDILHKIANAYSEISMDWLITGKGEMYKTEYNAGRDNNINNGENKGVIGNSGIIGNMVSENSGNYVVMGEQKAKKIMKDGEVTIEMEQSAELELLQQTNSHLEIRIKDLETINASQSKTIETMQLLIDTLSKR